MPIAIDLSGRVALVTGASGGIGAAIARLLAAAGAAVGLGTHRGRDRARALEKEISAAGGRAVIVAADVSDAGGAGRCVEETVSALGGLDILVNNAGVWEPTPVDEATPEAVRRILAVNLEAAFHLARAALPHLRRSPAGRIVNVSSTASLLGEPRHGAYAASKGGLDALTRSLAVELGPDGITVNSVAPGWTETEMTRAVLETGEGERLRGEIPLRKVARPEDVAWAVAFLASDAAGHVSGVTLPVEGAYRLRR